MRDVLVVFGTRPEAIKLVPVIKALQQNGRVQTRVCVTGQHRDLLDQVLNFFDVTPDMDLKVMRDGQTLTEVTCAVLARLSDYLDVQAPDALVVHGDTTTTLAASLAAFYKNISLVHVEAGLRTFNKRAPYPEEVNRRVTDLLADLHFAPTDEAAQNLLDEAVARDSIVVTGNTAIDAVLCARSIVNARRAEYDVKFSPFQTARRPVILVTAHRRENFGLGIRQICEAIGLIARCHPDSVFIYPLHPNPHVGLTVQSLLEECGFSVCEKVAIDGHAFIELRLNRAKILIGPALAYGDFVYLLERSRFVLTDSGGIQEEATALNKPVLLMRNVTERPEAVDAEVVTLVGTDPDRICEAAGDLLRESSPDLSPARYIYGDGTASVQIATRLISWMESSSERLRQ